MSVSNARSLLSCIRKKGSEVVFFFSLRTVWTQRSRIIVHCIELARGKGTIFRSLSCSPQHYACHIDCRRSNVSYPSCWPILNCYRWLTFLRDTRALRSTIFYPSREAHKVTSILTLYPWIRGHWCVVSYLAAYRFETLNREFMFSDQLGTVISGLYGDDIAEVLVF